MKRLLCLTAALGAAAMGIGRAEAATITYDVNAWIDTTDYLMIHDGTLQWEHKTSGSPAGTHQSPQPTVISSTSNGVGQMNGVDWNQVWPSPLPSDAFSSIFTALTPALPELDGLTVTVAKISGRGTPTVTQQPTIDNNYTAIVQFTDGSSGADFLDASITVIPEPATLSMMAIAGLGLLRRRR